MEKELHDSLIKECGYTQEEAKWLCESHYCVNVNIEMIKEYFAPMVGNESLIITEEEYYSNSCPDAYYSTYDGKVKLEVTLNGCLYKYDKDYRDMTVFITILPLIQSLMSDKAIPNNWVLSKDVNSESFDN